MEWVKLECVLATSGTSLPGTTRTLRIGSSLRCVSFRGLCFTCWCLGTLFLCPVGLCKVQVGETVFNNRPSAQKYKDSILPTPPSTSFVLHITLSPSHSNAIKRAFPLSLAIPFCLLKYPLCLLMFSLFFSPRPLYHVLQPLLPHTSLCSSAMSRRS